MPLAVKVEDWLSLVDQFFSHGAYRLEIIGQIIAMGENEVVTGPTSPTYPLS